MPKFFTLAPSLLPSYSEIIHRLRNGDHRMDAIASHLGVSVGTLRRWQRTDRVPKSVLLALFWESDLGYSAISTHLRNEVVTLHGLVGALKNEIAQLQARIDHIEGLEAHGAANAPVYGRQVRIARPLPPNEARPLALVR